MLSQNTTLAIPENVAFHPLGDGQQTVIVSMDSGYLFTCNQTAQAFLEAVDGQRTFGEIVNVLGEQFDVELGRLNADLMTLAQKLAAEGLLVAKGDGSLT